ncbi:MAG: STY4526/YPO1902 family pathogenicity island replication protein [Pseudomonadales bacterium]
MVNFEDQLCHAAAKSLIALLESIQADKLQDLTLSDEVIDYISELNLTQQNTLILRSHNFLKVTIDPSALQRQLEEVEEMHKERELEDQHLLLGAPLVLMRRLFGMHASEFSRRRRVLNIQGTASGRPPLCKETDEHQIWNLWESYSNTEERLRFIAIAETTGFDLHLIWSALREHITG